VGPSGRIRQRNLTDIESAKMPGSHGVVQGDNGVAAVDAEHQVIVHAEATGEGQEERLLKPRIEGIRENLATVTVPGGPLQTAVAMADNGFHSEENPRLVLTERIEAYLPDTRFRKREPVFANIRHVCELDHFTLRGLVKVNIQWKRYGMVHNILKILRFGPRFA
jgi:hypothetical protein